MSMGRGRRSPATKRTRPQLLAVPADPGSRRRAAYRWLLSRSTYLYAPGDMRRAYRWTRDALLALLLAAVLALSGRLVLTTVFVTHVSGDPTLVAAFNLGLTATAASGAVGLALARGRIRRWWRHRCPRAADPPPTRL